ncbi:conserved exported protein of unknown function [Nitrospira sp. KM1]|uniref:carboxylesterase family protein n=1 Tax=Nitrospira sp. KM1 TaxID=1936990 RepID=UPI0013A7498A|nr:hypothetical protein [Nitrospira sp. KM1]BCA53992.1 conserved exported protein of unknown function [Nitrospira sp. KM1]
MKAWLCCAVLCLTDLWSCPIGWAQAPPTDSGLAALVFRYLDTGDGTEAESLLEKITRHPDASIERLVRVIQTERSYSNQPIGTLPDEGVVVRGRTYRFSLSVPLTYQPSKGYGLVVCLHGAGFTGEAYLERWQSRLGDDYVLACPTYADGAWFTKRAEELVLATIRNVQSRYHIDPDRIFLTGMSNGAIGTWLIGMHYAPMFAGLAPMAGGLDHVLMPFLANLRNTPVYMIHGSKDQVMPVELSRSIAAELTRLGYPHVYREHTREHPMAGGHYFPREELPDLVAWLNLRRRDPLPGTLTVVREGSGFQPFNWIRVEATDPIAVFSDNLVDKRDDRIKNREYARLEATVGTDNTIVVAAERVQRFSLFLNDQLVDFSKPVRVTTNGRIAYEGPVVPSLVVLLRQARLRQDPRQLFSVQLPIVVEAATP